GRRRLRAPDQAVPCANVRTLVEAGRCSRIGGHGADDMSRHKPKISKERPRPAVVTPTRAVTSRKMPRGPGLWCGTVIVLASLALYVYTAARDIVVGDTPELMTVAVTLGVAHPSGYPLLTLLGHVFSLLPFGPVAFRLDLLAAVCGAGAVGFIYLTAW